MTRLHSIVDAVNILAVVIEQIKQIMSGMIMLAINMKTWDYSLKTTVPSKSVGNSFYLTF